MDTVPYTIHRLGETTTVDAVHPVPGLYVYRTPEQMRNPNHPYQWVIGHSSGRAIAAFEYEADAISVAHELTSFTNWDRTAEELLADDLLDPQEIADYVEGVTPGVFMTANRRATQAA
ncbi:hypothetical protein ABZ312_11650 [Streptomyces sp. NPDC006207]